MIKYNMSVRVILRNEKLYREHLNTNLTNSDPEPVEG